MVIGAFERRKALSQKGGKKTSKSKKTRRRRRLPSRNKKKRDGVAQCQSTGGITTTASFGESKRKDISGFVQKGQTYAGMGSTTKCRYYKKVRSTRERGSPNSTREKKSSGRNQIQTKSGVPNAELVQVVQQGAKYTLDDCQRIRVGEMQPNPSHPGNEKVLPSVVDTVNGGL